MQIDRCVCYNRRFAELRLVAEQTGAPSVEALQEHVAFGLKCGLCHPYVRRMLSTGETVFTEVIEAGDYRQVTRAASRGTNRGPSTRVRE